MSISTRKLQVLSHLSKLDNQLHITTRSSILNKNLTDFFGCSEDCMLGGETKKKTLEVDISHFSRRSYLIVTMKK